MTPMTHAQHFSHGRVHASDDLFRQVEQAAIPQPEAIDQPIVSDSSWAAFDAACGDDEPTFRILDKEAA